MTAFVVNSLEQYEVALATLARRHQRAVASLREGYTLRLREEAWGEPEKAQAIHDAWMADLDALTTAHKQALTDVPKPPTIHS